MVASSFTVPSHHFVTRSRTAEVARARFAAWNILSGKGITAAQLIKPFRLDDTGTIRHGIRRSLALASAYPHYANHITECRILVENADGEAIKPPSPLDGLPRQYQSVLSAAASAFGITPAEIFLERRRRIVTEAQYAATLILIEQGETYRQINYVLNRVASYAYSANRYGRNLIKTDKDFARRVRTILQNLSVSEEQAA